MPRHPGERSSERRRDVNRLQRDTSVVDGGRYRDQVRVRLRSEKELIQTPRDRSPRGRPQHRIHTESPVRELRKGGGYHETDKRSRHDSPRKVPNQLKYVDEALAERSSTSWTEPSRDMAMLTHSVPHQYHIDHMENVDSPRIPEFNPESSKLNSEEWLNLLESVATERNWKSDEKLYIMTSRLSGFARQWYLTSGVNCKSWNEVKKAFSKAFPVQLDYHDLLKRMLDRTMQKSEALSTYVLHKVALLNECEIQGVKAVACIIAGLLDPKLKQQAKLQNCEDPDQLYLYLRTLNIEDSSTPKANRNEDAVTKKGLKWDKSDERKECLFCGIMGHVAVYCRQMKNHKCSVCHQIGHECEMRIPSNRRNEQNQIMFGSLSLFEANRKNFVDVYISGFTLGGYIDLKSECVTINEQSALQTRLPIRAQTKIIKGFAGAQLVSVGYIDTSICVGRDVANVRLFVLPDNLQNIPVVVGQEFINQPHIAGRRDSESVHLSFDNAEASFHY